MMTYILEVNAQGALYVPPTVLKNAQPHTRYKVDVQGDTLILRPTQKQPFWATATPAERAARLRQWASSFKGGSGLSDEALRREYIYDYAHP